MRIGKAAWKHMAVAMIASVLAVIDGAGSLAQDESNEKLSIELNKVEDVGGACHASFVIYNNLDKALDRLTLDLYLFDKAGVISQHTVLDMGPLPHKKTRIMTFSLVNDLCENINRIVVNDMPCQASGGEEVDCINSSAVWSINRVEFVP